MLGSLPSQPDVHHAEELLSLPDFSPVISKKKKHTNQETDLTLSYSLSHTHTHTHTYTHTHIEIIHKFPLTALIS
jgi:hypothetical protein